MQMLNKFWISIAIIISLSFLGACTNESQESDASLSHSSADIVAAVELQDESSSEIDLAEDGLAYLTQLSLMRGHLLVGRELYQAGHVEHAKMHMKHPESELYSLIEPALYTRGSDGFAAELEALALAVEIEADIESVDEAYSMVVAAIAKSEALVDARSEADRLELAAALLQVAAEEYAIAVVDGKMENAHEYQDAYGFSQIAKALIGETRLISSEKIGAIQQASKIIEELRPMWPSLIPPETLQTEASQLYKAAAQIDLLADSLK